MAKMCKFFQLDDETMLCKGAWTNNYLWKRCYWCIFCPIELCENCEHSRAHGPHMACGFEEKEFRGWMPQSHAVNLYDARRKLFPHHGCKNYRRITHL